MQRVYRKQKKNNKKLYYKISKNLKDFKKPAVYRRGTVQVETTFPVRRRTLKIVELPHFKRSRTKR